MCQQKTKSHIHAAILAGLSTLACFGVAAVSFSTQASAATKTAAHSALTVGQLESHFAGALGISGAQAAYFGSAQTSDPATASILADATAKYFGITSWSYEPGGTEAGWANAIGLYDGMPSGGNISAADVGQMVANLTHLNDGYYYGNGEYHLVYRPVDVASSALAKDPNVTASQVESETGQAIAYMNQITFVKNGTGFIFKAPTIPMSAKLATWNMAIGDWNTSTAAWYNFGGNDWNKADNLFGYNSYYANAGGYSQPPATFVNVKTPGVTTIMISYEYPKANTSLLLAHVSQNGSSLKVKYGSFRI